MKKIIILLLLLAAKNASASALASIYDGEEFKLDGEVLVQDYQTPTDFYILPQRYTVIQQSVYNPKTRRYTKIANANNIVTTENGKKYSIYTLRLRLVEPSQNDLLNATFLLRQKHPGAQIKGLAPICGMTIAMPGQDLPSRAANPDVPLITYSIKSTSSQKCGTIVANSEFTMSIHVPLESEPMYANALTSNGGLILPPIDVAMPYKYEDKVKITVDAKSFYKQVKAGAGIEGSWKVVSVGVKANVEKALQTLNIGGLVKMDCQNPDKTICGKFYDQAVKILSDSVMKYMPIAATNPNQDPLITTENNKSPGTNMFRVDMAYDEATAEKMVNLVVDFKDTEYDTLTSQVQLDISNLPQTILSDEVKAILNHKD